MLTSAAPLVKLVPGTTPEQQSYVQGIDRALTLFWTLVQRLQNAADQQQPIHQVEEIIFRDLLTMGLALLRSFLATSGDGDVGPTRTIPGERPDEPPHVLPRLDEPRSRPYLSIFGEVTIERIGYGEDRLDAAPLDARLRLPRPHPGQGQTSGGGAPCGPGRSPSCACSSLTVGPDEHVFLNRRGEPLTRFGVHALVERHARKAAAKLPSLASKRVGPHTIRHTTATHLLRAGVDINTIRAWLGHVSLATTNVYAEVDLEMKAKALETCEIKAELVRKAWRQNAGVMEFLRSL